MCPKKRRNIFRDACKCVGITKLIEKKTGLSANMLLITQQCKIGHLGAGPKLWNIGGLFCPVQLCQIHVTRATVPTLSIPLHIVDWLSALQTAQNEHHYRLPTA